MIHLSMFSPAGSDRDTQKFRQPKLTALGNSTEHFDIKAPKLIGNQNECCVFPEYGSKRRRGQRNLVKSIFEPWHEKGDLNVVRLVVRQTRKRSYSIVSDLWLFVKA